MKYANREQDAQSGYWSETGMEGIEREKRLRQQAEDDRARIQRDLDAVLRTVAQRERDFVRQLRQAKEDLDSANARQLRVQAENLQALSQQLEESRCELSKSCHQSAEREKMLTEQNEALRVENQTLKTTIQSQIERYEEELSSRQGEYNRSVRAASELETALRSDLATAQKAQEEFRRDLARVQQEVDGMRSSFSWRLTYPLRGVSGFFGSQQRLAPIAAQVAIQQYDVDSQLSVSPATTLDELLSQQDKAFVHCAYQTLLGRSPDPDGFGYYLDRLRAGAPKTHIVARLRLSREGRTRGIEIPGLKEVVWRYKLFQHPIVRPFANLLTLLGGRGLARNRLRALESQHYAFCDETTRRIAQLEQKIADIRSAPSGKPRSFKSYFSVEDLVEVAKEVKSGGAS